MNYHPLTSVLTLSDRPYNIFFCFRKKKTQKQINKKQKKLKKNSRKKMFLWTVSGENLMGYNDIVLKFALYAFNLRDEVVMRTW